MEVLGRISGRVAYHRFEMKYCTVRPSCPRGSPTFMLYQADLMRVTLPSMSSGVPPEQVHLFGKSGGISQKHTAYCMSILFLDWRPTRTQDDQEQQNDKSGDDVVSGFLNRATVTT